MHPHISDLYSLAQKPSRLIIGLMSGTSLDGLDVALCHIKDTGLATQIELLDFETVPYDQYYRDQIRAVFSKRQVDLETVCLLNNWVGEQHAKMIQQCLDQWKRPASSIDLIASHGQTIYHAPQSAHQHPGFSNATLQIGDGDHIAYRTGITTISDFRQKHIAAGGEGAPLAVYGDYLIFSSQQENRILLNLGGIANFTYLPKSMDTTQVLSTDVGTGNTMMDAFVQHHFPGQHYDANAELARRGQVDHDLLAALKAHVFFSQALPKTTGPELFNLQYLKNALLVADVHELSIEDTLATLNRFSADTIAESLRNFLGNQSDYAIYASGGGFHNPLLIENIQQQLPQTKIQSTAELGIHPDAKEAVLFAVLANECVAGNRSDIGNSAMGIPAVSMGKLSFVD